MAAGRKEGSVEGISLEEAPFYDLILHTAYGKDASDEIKLQLKPIIKEALPLIKQEIRISGFGKREKKLKSLVNLL